MSDHRTLSEQLADQQQDRHIDKHIAGMVEIETKLLNERIATLEARVKELEKRDANWIIIQDDLDTQIKELEGELAGWQQRYADQMRNPKQRQAYLAQLEKRKERG